MSTPSRPSFAKLKSSQAALDLDSDDEARDQPSQPSQPFHPSQSEATSAVAALQRVLFGKINLGSSLSHQAWIGIELGSAFSTVVMEDEGESEPHLTLGL